MARHSDMSRSRALLTGRSGFTGRYVAQELEQRGYEVFGLSSHERPGDSNSVQVDVLDREAVAKAVSTIAPDAVIHLAAISFVAHGDADEIYRVNVVGTRNLLEAVAECGKIPEIVVLASSANIYGNAEVDPITETTQPAPANDYAVSKLAMEYMARLWTDKLPIVITRPFNYTGVGQSERFLIPKIVGHFKRREKVIELGNTAVWRDFGDVRDVARYYVELVEQKVIRSTVNLCTGIGYSLGDILEMMANIAGYRINVNVNPSFIRANEVRRLVGSPERMRGIIGDMNVTPLHDTLNWMYMSD